MLAIDPENGAPVWVVSTNSKVYAPVTVYGGMVIFGGDSGLQAFGEPYPVR